jgi:hypothetical protein
MSGDRTAGLPRQDRALVTAAEWFAGGHRIPYDPESGRVLTEEEVAASPGGLRVFERVAAAEQDADLLAAAIRDIAERHGVGTPAPPVADTATERKPR